MIHRTNGTSILGAGAAITSRSTTRSRLKSRRRHRLHLPPRGGATRSSAGQRLNIPYSPTNFLGFCPSMGLGDLARDAREIAAYREALYGSPRPSTNHSGCSPATAPAPNAPLYATPRTPHRALPTDLRASTTPRTTHARLQPSPTYEASPTQWEGVSLALRTESVTIFGRLHTPEFSFAACPVDDALEMLVEGVDEPPAVPKETPAQMGQRLADEAFPTHYKITKRKIEKMVRKKIAARVRLPRASASMRIKFKLDLAPQLGIKAMCEEAGLLLNRKGWCAAARR